MKRPSALVPVAKLARIPDGVDFAQAAALPVAGGTALQGSVSWTIVRLDKITGQPEASPAATGTSPILRKYPLAGGIDLAGVHPCWTLEDARKIMALARKRKLVVIEDAAHAHGASYRNHPAGLIGHMASFSFQSSKNLTCGEGGIITTVPTNDGEGNTLLHALEKYLGGPRLPGSRRNQKQRVHVVHRLDRGVWSAQALIDLDRTARDFNAGPGNLARWLPAAT